MKPNCFNQIRVNCLADRFNNVLHVTTSTAITTGVAIAVNSPVLTATSLAAGYVLTYLYRNNIESTLADNYGATTTPSLPDDSRKLNDANRQYSERLGLKTPPSLYILSDGKSRTKNEPKGELHEALVKKLSKYMNAFAYGSTRKGVVMSASLIKGLDEIEEKAALAHEIGHLAANHTRVRKLTHLFKSAAAITTGIRKS